MHYIASITIATMLMTATASYAEILGTTATVRPDNSLIVDIQVSTGPTVAKLLVTYQTAGVDPLVSRLTASATTGPTAITIGRLRANRTYTYTVRGIDDHGGPSGTAQGSFTTGQLPAALLQSTYTLQGRMTVPLVVLSRLGAFRGFVAVDVHSADAPQIVWYYSNPASSATGAVQVDSPITILQEPSGQFIFADTGTGGPVAADSFYREITPDGMLLNESPPGCASLTPPSSVAPPHWMWAQGNDIHEVLLPGADGVPGTVLHLGKVVKDPFFDAGLAAQGARLQLGTTIRRWDTSTRTDTVVWDPFDFLDPLTERTNSTNSDPGINSDSRSPMPCAGATLSIEEWTHSNSLQVAPTGELLQSIRHLDTVVAIAPQFDRIAWRIGRFRSDFAFPNPSDRFYHQHNARLLDNGNLLLFDNGNGRPAAEGGLYSRALELALDWESMTVTNVWEYRHAISSQDGSTSYKYTNATGSAERLQNGNTLVSFGTDIDPRTQLGRTPQTFTLVEADASREASAVAVLDMQIPGEPILYRALPVTSLFGEVPGKSHD
jgi:Arylsulfotransferase (ASST)